MVSQTRTTFCEVTTIVRQPLAMERTLIVTCLVATICGISTAIFAGPDFGRAGGRGSGWGPLSKRDENDNKAAPISAQYVADLVAAVLKNASQGIDVSDLGQAVEDIEDAAKVYLRSKGLKAPPAEVHNLIIEIASKLNIAPTVSGLYDEPLTVEVNLLDAAFKILQVLVEKIKELEAAGQPSHIPITAIVATARGVEKSLLKAVGIITFEEAQDDGDDVESREAAQRSLTKRGKGKFTAGGYYRGRGDWGANIGFTYTFGKR